MATNFRSDVFTNELDTSFIAPILANTYAVVLGRSKQGPLNPQFVTSFDDFVSIYGEPDASIGFMHHSAMAFFEEGGGMWIKRVTDGDHEYGGLLLQNFNAGTGSEPRVLRLTAYSASDPEDVDFDSITVDGTVLSNDINDNLAFIYAIGPGAYSNNIAIAIDSQNINAPEAPTLTAVSNTSSTLTDGTAYAYRITAFSGRGETVASAEASQNGADNMAIEITWAAVLGARGYRVYKQSAGSGNFELLASVNADTVTYTDTGGDVTSGRVPPTTGPDPVDFFNIEVYDTRLSSTTPQEIWECSLTNRTNGFGVQTELTEQINNNSQYIRVNSNVANTDIGVPDIFSQGQTSFASGNDGMSIGDSDLSLAVDEFVDKEAFPASIFLDGGTTTIAWQSKLISICEARGDSIAFLTVPANMQEEQDAISYRAATLNANSNRGALFTNDHYVLDPYNDQSLFIPASAVAAARVAFTDQVANAAFSPAGFRRGVATTTQRLRHRYTNTQRDRLAAANVNYFTAERGFGFVLREAYTLQSASSALSYIPVRRVLDIAEQSTERALKIYLQEPNDELLSMQILSLLRSFYRVLQNRRMIRRFDVHSDTPNSEIALGNLIVYSLIEPLLPAVRIRHTAVLTQQGADFSSVIESL